MNFSGEAPLYTGGGKRAPKIFGKNEEKTGQAEAIVTRLQDMPENIQNRCVQIVELFLESVNEGRTED